MKTTLLLCKILLTDIMMDDLVPTHCLNNRKRYEEGRCLGSGGLPQDNSRLPEF